MRALLRDQEDNTLLAIEVTEAYYVPDDQILYMETITGDTYCAGKMIQINADSIVRELYERGAADLTSYSSWLDESD